MGLSLRNFKFCLVASFDVVARADLMALVTRLEQAQLMGCADESCMTDIGALAEADFLVASSVTPAGDGRLFDS